MIDLLEDGDRVAGAIALDENGYDCCHHGRQHDPCTGGGSRVYDISTNSSSGTGDGFAMGYRAGAERLIWRWSSSTRPARCTPTMPGAGS